MLIVFDKLWYVHPLRKEFPDAQFVQWAKDLPEGDDIVVAMVKPPLQVLEDMRERATVLTYFYGDGGTMSSTVLLVCDDIIVETEKQRDTILQLNPHKDVRTLRTPVMCVMTLARDNAQYVQEYAGCIEAAQKSMCLSVCVLENDSVDGTADKMQKALPDARVFSMKLGTPKLPGGRTIARTKMLAMLRNRLVDLANIHCGEFTMILDTQVRWSPAVVESHLELLRSRPDVAMVTSWGTVRRSEPCEFMFDTFATIINGRPLGFEANLFPCQAEGPKHDFQCHRRRGTVPIFKEREVQEIDSGCGGLFIIRSDVLAKCRWDVTHPQGCEHWEFCRQVREHGKVVVNPVPGPVSWEG